MNWDNRMSSTGGGSCVEYSLNNAVISPGFRALRVSIDERADPARGYFDEPLSASKI